MSIVKEEGETGIEVNQKNHKPKGNKKIAGKRMGKQSEKISL